MIWNTEVVCPTCSATAAIRVNRSGFLQRKVLASLGYFPWKCGECGCTFLFRKRGHEPHSHRVHHKRRRT